MVLKAELNDNSFDGFDLANAVHYATNKVVDIINMRLGGFGDSGVFVVHDSLPSLRLNPGVDTIQVGDN